MKYSAAARIAPAPPADRRELLRDAAIEAARAYMAAQLRAEREEPHQTSRRRRWTGPELDALQTLRDALAAERASRGGR